LAGRPQRTTLDDKHWKALQLIEEGDYTLKDIAGICKIPEETLYELKAGNIAKQGQVAALFQSESEKITAKLVKKAQDLSKTNMALAHVLITRILKTLEKKKNQSKDDKKLVCKLMMCIAASQPKVSIGSLSYSVTKGMNPQELVHEFTRLATIANGASQRSAVQTPLAGRPRVLPAFNGAGDFAEEEPETPSV